MTMPYRFACRFRRFLRVPAAPQRLAVLFLAGLAVAGCSGPPPRDFTPEREYSWPYRDGGGFASQASGIGPGWVPADVAAMRIAWAVGQDGDWPLVSRDGEGFRISRTGVVRMYGFNLPEGEILRSQVTSVRGNRLCAATPLAEDGLCMDVFVRPETGDVRVRKVLNSPEDTPRDYIIADPLTDAGPACGTDCTVRVIALD